MEFLASVLAFFKGDFSAYIVAAQAFLAGSLALALVIPGDQPDKALQWVVDLISKFSRK